jgi:hypothetical protein
MREARQAGPAAARIAILATESRTNAYVKESVALSPNSIARRIVIYRPTDGTSYTAISNGDGTFPVLPIGRRSLRRIAVLHHPIPYSEPRLLCRLKRDVLGQKQPSALQGSFWSGLSQLTFRMTPITMTELAMSKLLPARGPDCWGPNRTSFGAKTHAKKVSLAAAATASFFLLFPLQLRAQGGPPYYTNDPSTPGNRTLEGNLAYMPFLYTGRSTIHVPDVDINYGIGDRFQLTYENAWSRVKEGANYPKYGLGQDILLGELGVLPR